MGFALLDTGLIAYANDTSSRTESSTIIATPLKEKSALLTEEKIEKRKF